LDFHKHTNCDEESEAFGSMCNNFNEESNKETE